MQTLPTRNQVPENLRWDLTSIFPSDKEWEASFALLSSRIPALAAFKGQVADSSVTDAAQQAHTLWKALSLRDELSEVLGKLYVYAHMSATIDTRDAHYQSLSDRIGTLSTSFSTAAAFFREELLAIGLDRFEILAQEQPKLAVYEEMFRVVERSRKHTRTTEIEEILAAASEPMETPRSTYSMLTDADVVFPKIMGADGKRVQVTHGSYVEVHMDNPDRSVRKRAFNAYLGMYKRYKNTIATTYAGVVKGDIFMRDQRRYGSCLEASLGTEIPTLVYENLVNAVDKNLKALHRYLKLRKKVLGVDKLHMYDLYVPLVPQLNKKYSWEEGIELVLKALAPLGEEYVAIARQGLNSRWADVVESEGKQSGAYSWGAYGTLPFMFLNWQGTLDSVFTLAHELGHSMHSWLTRRAQPYVYGDYEMLVAEVASTFNEQLLAAYLLKNADSDEFRRYVINHILEGFRGTLFRQVQFAEFELAAHKMAEEGKALNAESLRKLFGEISQRYFGPVCSVDKLYDYEWSRIPHFWRSFYVYTYGNGISCGVELSRQVLTEGKPAVDRYLKMLSSGSSKNCVELLRDAGVDITTEEPYQSAIEVFEKFLDEFEKVV